MNEILEAAQKYHAAGLNPFPVNHRDKSPLIKELKPLFTKKASHDQITMWFSNNGSVKALGTTCGKIAGGLTVLDFDAPKLYFQWRELAKEHIDLSLLPVQKTGRKGDGYQVFIRCEKKFRNKKLAWVKVEPCDKYPDGKMCGIETRGESGYVVLPPSLHPDGGVYAWELDFARTFHTVAPELFDILINLARSLDEFAPDNEGKKAFEQAVKNTKPRTGKNSSVIQAFNDAHDIRKMLVSYGYTVREDMLCRPGREGHHSIWIKDNHSFHFSSNDPLNSEHLHDCFDIFCHFEHGENVKAAAEILDLNMIKRTDPAVGKSEPDRVIIYDRNDRGVSLILKDRFGMDIRFNADRLNAWLIWDGRRWSKDENRRVYEYFGVIIKEILETAASCSGDTQTNYLKWVTYLSTDRAQNSALAFLSKNFADLKVEIKDLDSESWLLNCNNGTVDLRTGELRPHRREDLITRLCPVEFHPGTQSRTWNDFLETVLPDPAVRHYLQKAAGYSLTGDVSEEKLFFAFGPPATGKSTFLGAVQAVMGEYSITTDFTSFLASKMKDTGPRNDIAALAGYRLVSSIEVEDGQHMAEGLLCLLTGGDRIRARFLRKESFEYKPTFKIWLAANNRPDVSSGESALWRRMKLIPFDQVIPENKRDLKVKKILENPDLSGAAILAWLVEGCLLWQKEGLKDEPDAIRALTEEYRHESDPLRDFIETCCEINTENISLCTGKQELYNRYQTFCESINDKYPLGKKNFNKRLFARGLRESRVGSNKTRVWAGIRIL